MAKAKIHTSNALEILDRLDGDDPELRAMVDWETINGQIAQMIHDARKNVRLRGLQQDRETIAHK